jgi:hypothetical protein
MDVRLIPVLTVLYLLSFLDRNNIGNAAIQGLTTDLRLTPDQFNWCLTAFFFTYCAFEVPSNLLLKKLRPSRWLPAIMVAWGLVMTLMGLVQDFKGLLIARLFLGFAEAGLPPGIAVRAAYYCLCEDERRNEEDERERADADECVLFASITSPCGTRVASYKCARPCSLRVRPPPARSAVFWRLPLARWMESAALQAGAGYSSSKAY